MATKHTPSPAPMRFLLFLVGLMMATTENRALSLIGICLCVVMVVLLIEEARS